MNLRIAFTATLALTAALWSHYAVAKDAIDAPVIGASTPDLRDRVYHHHGAASQAFGE